jgi:hypothetical protein
MLRVMSLTPSLYVGNLHVQIGGILACSQTAPS